MHSLCTHTSSDESAVCGQRPVVVWCGVEESTDSRTSVLKWPAVQGTPVISTRELDTVTFSCVPVEYTCGLLVCASLGNFPHFQGLALLLVISSCSFGFIIHDCTSLVSDLN